MNYLYPFLPAFVKRLDKHLLLHYPVLWAMQVHSVTFFGLMWLWMIVLLTYFIPLQTFASWDYHLLKFLPLIPSIILGGLWAYHQEAYKVEDSYGLIKAKYHRIRFFSYVWVLIFLSLPLLLGNSIIAHRLEMENSAINIKSSSKELWLFVTFSMVWISFAISIARQIGWKYLLLTLTIHSIVVGLLYFFQVSVNTILPVSLLWLAVVGIAAYECTNAIESGKPPKWYYVVMVISGQLIFMFWGIGVMLLFVYGAYNTSISYGLFLIASTGFIGYYVIPKFSHIYLALLANPREF